MTTAFAVPASRGLKSFWSMTERTIPTGTEIARATWDSPLQRAPETIAGPGSLEAVPGHYWEPPGGDVFDAAVSTIDSAIALAGIAPDGSFGGTARLSFQ